MTQYHKTKFDLTKKQYNNLAKALSTTTPLTMRVTQEQMGKGDGDLLLTQRQKNHIDKSMARGKGSNLSLSATQLKKMRAEHRRGGYLVAMNKAIAGEGMYGVDQPGMPRDAGIGPEAQDGAGVKDTAVKVVKTVGKIAKPIVKVGAKELCKLGSKVLAVKVGVDPTNPVLKVVSDEGCKQIVDSIIGKGRKRKV